MGICWRSISRIFSKECVRAILKLYNQNLRQNHALLSNLYFDTKSTAYTETAQLFCRWFRPSPGHPTSGSLVHRGCGLAAENKTPNFMLGVLCFYYPAAGET